MPPPVVDDDERLERWFDSVNDRGTPAAMLLPPSAVVAADDDDDEEEEEEAEEEGASPGADETDCAVDTSPERGRDQGIMSDTVELAMGIVVEPDVETEDVM